MAFQVISTRGKYNTSTYDQSGGNSRGCSAVNMPICCDSDIIKIPYASHYITGGTFADTPYPTQLTITASIELTINGVKEYRPFTFSGQSSGIVNNGIPIISDPLQLDRIYPAGSVFKIWNSVLVPSGGFWSGGLILKSENGEGNTPYGTDYTLTGTNNLSTGNGFHPLCIIGDVKGNLKPATKFIGDSILDDSNDPDRRGYMARIFDSIGYPYVNFAVKSYSANGLKTPSTRPGITACLNLPGMVFEKTLLDVGGANDLQGGNGTASNVYSDTLALIESLNTEFGESSYAHASILPLATGSSDSFTTFAGQTMRGNNAFRAELESNILANPNITSLPTARVVSVNSDTSFSDVAERWLPANPSLTDDGVHPNINGITLLSTNMNLINAITSWLGQITIPIITGLKSIFKWTLKPTLSNPELTLTNLFDNVIFVKNALNESGNPIQEGERINSVPPVKGTRTLLRAVSNTFIAEELKYNPRLGGLVNLDNVPQQALTTLSAVAMPFPFEIHVTGYLTSFFPGESYLNCAGEYLGDYNNGGLRTITFGGPTSEAREPDGWYEDTALPRYIPFQLRMVYDINKRVTLYLDGVQLGTSKLTSFTGTANTLTQLALGTDSSNNAKWYASSILQINRLLTTDEANTTYLALKQIYNTEVVPQNIPLAKNITITSDSTNIHLTYDYYHPLGITQNDNLTVIRWYGAGNSPSAPDVTRNHHIVEFDNLRIINKSTFASILSVDSNLRADVEVTAINGDKLGSASGCKYEYTG